MVHSTDIAQVDCYESNYVYMGLQNAFKMDVNKFARVKVGK
jgi:hypothetical protein